jgi:hypothetical protein
MTQPPGPFAQHIIAFLHDGSKGEHTSMIIHMRRQQPISTSQPTLLNRVIRRHIYLDLDLTVRLAHMDIVDFGTFRWRIRPMSDCPSILRWIGTILLDRDLVGSKIWCYSCGQLLW